MLDRVQLKAAVWGFLCFVRLSSSHWIQACMQYLACWWRRYYLSCFWQSNISHALCIVHCLLEIISVALQNMTDNKYECFLCSALMIQTCTCEHCTHPYSSNIWPAVFAVMLCLLRIRDQPNSREKMRDFTVDFLKCSKFHGKFTEGVWEIHGPHSHYFEVLC